MDSNLLRDAESHEFTIPANGYDSFDFQGRFIRCLESDGRLNLSFNHGGKSYLEAGIARHVPLDGGDFESFQLFNDNDYDVTVILALGYGDVTDDRLSATGVLRVQNEAGEKLDVEDTSMQAKIDELLMLMQSANLQRAPLTTLENADFASAAGTTVSLCTAAENTSGVIIRSFYVVFLNLRENNTGLYIDGNPLGTAASGTSSGGYDSRVLENYFIPAGKSVELRSVTPDFSCNAWYEVL